MRVSQQGTAEKLNLNLNLSLNNNRIKLAHGGGGRMMSDLVQEMFVKTFSNKTLNKLGDSAIINLSSKRIAFTTDAFVVKPYFFNGGDIGKVAVCGTVNDLAVQGAEPKVIALSVILEEGFLLDELKKIVVSIKKWSDIACVQVVTGDTKVVEKGSADGIYISTSGIGLVPDESKMLTSDIDKGDSVIVTGTIGDHGMTVLAHRNGFDKSNMLQSDCAPLNEVVSDLSEFGDGIKWMRDITRGGLAACLNELAEAKKVSIEIDESLLPVNKQARAISELLGIDILVSASEGKMALVVDRSIKKDVISALKNHKYSSRAGIIGEITSTEETTIFGLVGMRTSIGSTRVINMPSGELLPRIC